MRRFHLPDLPAVGEVWLDGDEGRHLARVLRAAPGDRVGVFDGAGTERVCEVRAAERNRVLLAIGDLVPERRPVRQVTLLTAIPRGKRMDDLVEKVTEAGAACVAPWGADRSVRQVAGPNVRRRWERHALSACKQAGRSRVPVLAEPTDLASALGAAPAGARFVLDPRGEQELAGCIRGLDAVPVTLVVGPEGGFSTTEHDLLEREDVVRARLGGLVLRIETAAAIAVHTAAGLSAARSRFARCTPLGAPTPGSAVEHGWENGPGAIALSQVAALRARSDDDAQPA